MLAVFGVDTWTDTERRVLITVAHAGFTRGKLGLIVE